eukprot:COSAG01_NODE_12117_length_1798_cov_2.559741_2_plen_86_part_00
MRWGWGGRHSPALLLVQASLNFTSPEAPAIELRYGEESFHNHSVTPDNRLHHLTGCNRVSNFFVDEATHIDICTTNSFSQLAIQS